jgi:Fusaric acid resistance protein-like
VVRLAAALAFLFVPAVVLSVTPLRPVAVLVFVGEIPALVALAHGRRFAVIAGAGTAVLVALVELAHPHPLAAAFLMAAVGLGIGATTRRGWQSVATVACTWPAVLLISAPARLAAPGWLSGTAAAVLLPALVTLLGGLWAVLARLLLPSLPPGEVKPLPRSTAAVYGISLAVLLGASAYVASTWARGSMAGWVLLTILVIARPGYAETWRRVVTRSLGTIVGGVAAGALAFAVPHRPALVAVGSISLIAAIVLQLKRASYAVYACALTAAIVLLSARNGHVYATDVQRVLFTVIGAVLAAALLLIVEVVLHRLVPEERRAPGPAEPKGRPTTAAPPGGPR